MEKPQIEVRAPDEVRVAEREQRMLEMFNRAAECLTDEDYVERERLLDAFAHQD